MLRLFSELFWTLRREGLEISPAQAVLAVQSAALVGLDDRSVLADALACIVVTRREDLPVFHRVFARFFRADAPHPGDLFARLVGRGFGPAEVDLVRDLLEAARHRTEGEAALSLRAFAGPVHDLDHLLFAARMRTAVADLAHPDQVGFFDQLTQRRLGMPSATGVIAAIRRALTDAFGVERGAALGAWLEDEWRTMRRRVREHVERLAQTRTASPAGTPPPLSVPTLDEAERRALSRGLRRLAEKIRGSLAVRRRRARAGRADARATIRRALRTGGVPFETVRRRRRHDRPRLVVVCDVSESVRAHATFMLGFVGEAQGAFQSTRSFVFVSELRETTALFRTRSSQAAIDAIAGGHVVTTTANSNYGRAFVELEEMLRGTIDRRTTVVVLGDGRTNHLPTGEAALRRIARRARGVLWLSPEPRSLWGRGDSAMRVYRQIASRTLEVRDPRQLMDAAAALARLR